MFTKVNKKTDIFAWSWDGRTALCRELKRGAFFVCHGKSALQRIWVQTQ